MAEPGTCGKPCPDHGDPCSLMVTLDATEAEVAAIFTGKTVSAVRREHRQHTEHLCFPVAAGFGSAPATHRWTEA